MSDILFKAFAKGTSVFGIGGISQSVAGDVVARCAEPNLSDEEFEALAQRVAEQGYKLEMI